MNYLIYKITNTVNNKIYIGCHKTEDVNDSYMGSGKILKRAIEKYGIDNFTKKILHNFDNSADMFSMESELVNEDFVKDQNNYNLKEGGHGGAVNMKETEYYKSGRHLENYRIAGKIGGNKSAELKKGIHSLTRSQNSFNGKKGQQVCKERYPNGPFYEKNHTDETKQQMRLSHKGKHTGSKNSQFGTMWITDDVISKKIKKDQPIPDGFRKGRKIK